MAAHDPIRAAIDAVKSGADPVRAAYGESGQFGDTDSAGMSGSRSAESVSVSRNQDPDLESPLLVGSDESDDSPQETSEVPVAPQKKQATAEKSVPGDKKKIPVNKGKEFIEVDYSNKEAVDKAFLLAHGARKWQAQKDAAEKKVAQLNTENQTNQARLQQLQSEWSQVEQAFQQDGVAGLVNLLGGGGAYEKFLTSEIEKQNFLKKASPEQLEMYQAREDAEKQKRRIAQMEEENAKFRASIESDRDATEKSKLQADINPSFFRHNFSGKLGDPVAEEHFNEALWQKATLNLTKLETSGVPLTQEIIDKEFRKVASHFRKPLGVQATKTVKKMVDTKKQEATEAAQSRAMTGFRGSSEADETNKMLADGDVTSILRNWGKTSKFFGGR